MPQTRGVPRKGRHVFRFGGNFLNRELFIRYGPFDNQED